MNHLLWIAQVILAAFFFLRIHKDLCIREARARRRGSVEERPVGMTQIRLFWSAFLKLPARLQCLYQWMFAAWILLRLATAGLAMLMVAAASIICGGKSRRTFSRALPAGAFYHRGPLPH